MNTIKKLEDGEITADAVQLEAVVHLDQLVKALIGRKIQLWLLKNQKVFSGFLARMRK
uniref:Uncharacterized protein n=1 Tax=uncultured Thiotrichaceae bacterium TaxID=298394 RepID=A0A6S6TVP7_9GAMM|nr:MAG: Unknown protein [uncultured Thiotrichaceae bacterium]